MYSSNETTNFQELNPEYGKSGYFKATGHKTINGAINEAKQITYALTHNCKLYLHAVINIDFDLTENEHRNYWAKISRYLRRSKVIGWYRRELCEVGRIHYHILTATYHELKALKQTIIDSLPQEIKSVSRVHVERIRDQFHTCAYVNKMKLAGDRNGRYYRDKHGHKRRIFKKECKLTVHGEIGNFWKRSIKSYWKDCIAEQEAKTNIKKAIARYRTPERKAKARIQATIIDDSYETYLYILSRWVFWAYLKENPRPTN
jgi:hypothetical protein